VRQGFTAERIATINQVRDLLSEFGIVIAKGRYRLRARLPEVLEDAQNALPSYLIAIGLMIACTAPVIREGPSVNRNSQAWSFTISSVFMFSRM
jgi:hypothetical protein